MNSAQMNSLLDEHSSKKKKMILGIVFVAVAFFIEMIGFALFADYYTVDAGLGLIVLSLPFWGVGIPFLIIGIIGVIKTNRQISMLRAEETRAAAPQQPVYQQPVYQQPAAPQQPVYQQPVYQQPAEPQQPVYQQPVYQQSPAGFVDIDWQKYAPLDAGVSYNPQKDYGFHRADGFVGSVPQNFVNRTFPKCPICCSKEPYWTIAQHNQMSWKGNLYLFKCSHCEGIISMSMPDVTTLGNGASGVVANPTVGLTNLMAKASSGKEVGAVYAVIESVGNSGVSPMVAGKEFKLEHMQDMYLRM